MRIDVHDHEAAAPSKVLDEQLVACIEEHYEGIEGAWRLGKDTEDCH